MARKQYVIKQITLSQNHASPTELFRIADSNLSVWLGHTEAGKWCKLHATDLTFRITNKNHEYPTMNILARLNDDEYTMYVLKFGSVTVC